MYIERHVSSFAQQVQVKCCRPSNNTTCCTQPQNPRSPRDDIKDQSTAGLDLRTSVLASRLDMDIRSVMTWQQEQQAFHAYRCPQPRVLKECFSDLPPVIGDQTLTVPLGQESFAIARKASPRHAPSPRPSAEIIQMHAQNTAAGTSAPPSARSRMSGPSQSPRDGGVTFRERAEILILQNLPQASHAHCAGGMAPAQDVGGGGGVGGAPQQAPTAPVSKLQGAGGDRAAHTRERRWLGPV